MEQHKEIFEKFLRNRYPAKNVLFVGGCWSSIAFMVDDIIVRFPKKDMKDYESEAKILPYLKDKLSFAVPDVKIDNNQEHPYAYHKALVGKKWDLNEIQSIGHEKFDKLAKDCALLFYQLHQIPIKQVKAIIPDIKSHYKRELISEAELRTILNPYISKPQFDSLYSKYRKAVLYISDDLIFSHGDFSGSNSLLDDQNNLIGVFDWASCGIEEREYEFFRFWTEDNVFLNKVIDYYEDFSKVKINKKRIKDLFLLDNINILYAIHTREHLFSTRNSRMDWLLRNLKKLY